ncbi:MAG: hypothetical protein P4L71_15970 [Acetobacteraceae bacterium]|nr:hypothetical protein [Acetobacteraceae bacterium]
MHRLLSPNEAKFWLLDWVAPMNSVVVVQRAGHAAIDQPQLFAVPVVHTDAQQRPRWGEADRPGTLEHEDVNSDDSWLVAAQRLQDIRVGSAGHPPWHAVVQHHPDTTTLVLAVNHALTDWRTSLHVAHAFLNDKHSGPLAPPCEEMLPASSFGAPDAGALLDAWWSSRAALRWQALGRGGLTAILPHQAPTRFSLHRLSQTDTTRLQGRCEAEGVSLNGALAIALRDTMQIDAVAHSVDMDRFIRPAPPRGPGLAVAHVFTPLVPGPFWDAARDNRAALFEQIRIGAAGDVLLSLPRLLLGAEPTYQPAVMTITGAPTVGTRTADPDTIMQLVMSSARGGGGIVILSWQWDCLQLIAGTPSDQPKVPLQAVADQLLNACD